jgi:hypothetical protein
MRWADRRGRRGVDHRQLIGVLAEDLRDPPQNLRALERQTELAVSRNLKSLLRTISPGRRAAK